MYLYFIALIAKSIVNFFKRSFAKGDNPWHQKRYVPYPRDFYDTTLDHENLYLAAIARPDCKECYRTEDDCSGMFAYYSSVADHTGEPWDCNFKNSLINLSFLIRANLV